jgi:UDP-3-O-[3-hydroxymyristoyl] glucosamine N-acyltransferase
MKTRTLSAAEIAELLGVATASTAVVARVSGLEGAGPDAMVFAEDEKTLAAAVAGGAGLILARSAGGQNEERVLVVKDPRYAFAVCAKALVERRVGSEVHPSAVVDASVRLGERVKIGARVVVEAEVTLGDDVEIAWWCRQARCWGRLVSVMCAMRRQASICCFRNRGGW